MTEKLVLKSEKTDKTTLPVFIGVDLLDQLKEIKAETNLPIRKIVEKFIRYGLENVVIEDED